MEAGKGARKEGRRVFIRFLFPSSFFPSFLSLPYRVIRSAFHHVCVGWLALSLSLHLCEFCAWLIEHAFHLRR